MWISQQVQPCSGFLYILTSDDIWREWHCIMTKLYTKVIAAGVSKKDILATFVAKASANTRFLCRFLYVIQYYVGNGFYVAIDYHAGLGGVELDRQVVASKDIFSNFGTTSFVLCSPCPLISLIYKVINYFKGTWHFSHSILCGYYPTSCHHKTVDHKTIMRHIWDDFKVLSPLVGAIYLSATFLFPSNWFPIQKSKKQIMRLSGLQMRQAMIGVQGGCFWTF